MPRYLQERAAKDGGNSLLGGALLGAAIAVFPAYFAAEAVFSAYAHGVHWVATAAATLVAMGLGALAAKIRSTLSK